MRTAMLQLVVVVDPDQPALFERLSNRLGDTARVVLGRRRQERRCREGVGSPERRAGERRQLSTQAAREHLRVHGCHFVFEPHPGRPAPPVQYGLALCLRCEQRLEFEMPEFFEAPARVEIGVHHHLSGLGVQHMVGLEALTAPGRPLVASRVTARAAP